MTALGSPYSSLRWNCRIRERSQIRKTAGEGVSDVIAPLTFPRLIEQPLMPTTITKRDLKDSDWIEVCGLGH